VTVPQEWTDEVVRDHAAGIVFDGEEYEPECVLCQKAVGLGYFAHYGYEIGPDGVLIDGSPDA
jgi:hypothetical protein